MIIDNIKKVIEETFPENSEEFATIIDTYELIVGTIPTVISEAKTKLILLDISKTKLSTIYFLLNRQISDIRNTIQETYDLQYVQLVKRGRPSKDAIESEIRALNPEVSGILYTILKLEEIRDYITMLLKSVDSCKSSTIEILRNINRID